MAVCIACNTSGNRDLDTNTSNSQSVFKEHGTIENLFILTSELSHPENLPVGLYSTFQFMDRSPAVIPGSEWP